MITKHNIIVLCASLVIAASIPILYKYKSGATKVEYLSRTFHSGSGWGYDIVMNKKLIIHQEYIPAIAEKKEFQTEKQADAAAQLVLSKLKNNKFPTVSKAEVEQVCGVK